jgi:hypothetical protein
MIKTNKIIKTIKFAFSQIERKAFKKLDDNDINYFKSVLSKHAILTENH